MEKKEKCVRVCDELSWVERILGFVNFAAEGFDERRLRAGLVAQQRRHTPHARAAAALAPAEGQNGSQRARR